MVELEATVLVEGGGGLGVAGTVGLLELGVEGWMSTDGIYPQNIPYTPNTPQHPFLYKLLQQHHTGKFFHFIC